jgi:tight adherence protein C
MLLTYATGALAFGAAISVLCLWLAFDHFRARHLAQARLARFGVADHEVAVETAVAPSASNLLRRLGSPLARRASRERLRALNMRLIRAGVPGRPGVDEFLGMQVLLLGVGVALGAGIVLPIVVALGQDLPGLGWPLALLAICLGGVLGYTLPPLVLDRLSERRRRAIDNLLPNAVDVLTVSLEAGIGFDTAITFLCERGDDPLIVEFRRYLADLRLGRSRREALEALVERTQLASLGAFAAAVIQADELGTGLARALRGQTSALRTMRRIQAEERARQAPVKLLFPIVLCILPVLFIVIVGPALLRALAVLGG